MEGGMVIKASQHKITSIEDPLSLSCLITKQMYPRDYTAPTIMLKSAGLVFRLFWFFFFFVVIIPFVSWCAWGVSSDFKDNWGDVWHAEACCEENAGFYRLQEPGEQTGRVDCLYLWHSRWREKEMDTVLICDHLNWGFSLCACKAMPGANKTHMSFLILCLRASPFYFLPA